MRRCYYFIWVIAILWGLVACSEERKPSSVVTAKTTTPPKVVAEKKKPAVDAEWPYLQDADETVSVAKNLIAKNYVLIFDGSGSMGETECGDGRKKIDVALEAVSDWATSLPADANLGLVAFYYNKWEMLPLTPGDRNPFLMSIRSLVAGGRTPLTEAINRAYNTITVAGKKQLGYGEYTIVVVTDGIANNRTALSETVRKILNTSPINIYTIGFCIGQNHSLNQPGQTVYKAANNPEELKRGLSEVLAESDTFDETEFSQ